MGYIYIIFWFTKRVTNKKSLQSLHEAESPPWSQGRQAPQRRPERGVRVREAGETETPNIRQSVGKWKDNVW